MNSEETVTIALSTYLKLKESEDEYNILKDSNQIAIVVKTNIPRKDPFYPSITYHIVSINDAIKKANKENENIIQDLKDALFIVKREKEHFKNQSIWSFIKSKFRG